MNGIDVFFAGIPGAETYEEWKAEMQRRSDEFARTYRHNSPLPTIVATVFGMVPLVLFLAWVLWRNCE